MDIAAVRAENVPHVAKRRGPTDARSKLEIDDIVVLITFADENGILTKLPRYVADRPDQLPQLCVDKGDTLALFNKLEKLESVLVDIKRENCALKGAMSNIESAMMSHGLRPQPGNSCQQVRDFVNGDAIVSSDTGASETQPARRDPRFELAPSLQASGTPRRERSSDQHVEQVTNGEYYYG